MAELVDALDSGSSEVTLMEVQILLAAPVNKYPYLYKGFFIF